jgi:hypothetical protein
MRAILTVAIAFLLAAPCSALADKKNSSSGKSGGVSFNYGKIEQTYTQQATDKSTPKPGVNGGTGPKGNTRH